MRRLRLLRAIRTPASIFITSSLTLTLCQLTAQAAGPQAKPAGAAKPSPYPNYMQGLSLYQSRRYNEAIAAFTEAIKKNEAQAPAWLYVAHSYYGNGNRNQAIDTYKKICENFAGGREAAQAAQCLQRLGIGAPGGATGARTGKSGGLSQAPSAPPVKAAEGTAIKDIKERLEIVRPRVGHPDVTPAAIATMRKALDGITPFARQVLNEYQIKVVLTPTLIDKRPELAYQEGEGYDGASYKSCPGMYQSGVIYICESTVDEDTDEVKSPFSAADLTETFYHEMGHALDACLEQYSESDEYRHAYYLDIARVPDATAHRIKYFLQKSTTGQNESCAELTRLLMGVPGRNDEDIRTSFPLTAAVVKKKLKI